MRALRRQAECLAIKETEVERLRDFAAANEIGLTVVGPEVALAAGVVDAFKAARAADLRPDESRRADRIEQGVRQGPDGQIRYSDGGVPRFHGVCRSVGLRGFASASGSVEVRRLAAGKGVVIAETLEEADAALKDMLLDDKFGEGKVVVEDFLTGPEFSFMCFVSGRKVWPMALAQDHKRAFDGDKGPNTGGMGAYSPLPFVTAEDERYALERILQPTADAMVAEGCPFEGVLYGGLMKTPQGIKVIEFNARFGDPRTEVVLPRLKSDIVDIFCAVADGADTQLEWHDFATLGVVLASKGYPGSYEKGHEIKGLDRVGSAVYHMGTKADGGRILTAGGRVLFVVGKGATLAEARANALKDVAQIGCDNLFYRTDIGHWAFEK